MCVQLQYGKLIYLQQQTRYKAANTMPFSTAMESNKTHFSDLLKGNEGSLNSRFCGYLPNELESRTDQD